MKCFLFCITLFFNFIHAQTTIDTSNVFFKARWIQSKFNNSFEVWKQSFFDSKDELLVSGSYVENNYGFISYHFSAYNNSRKNIKYVYITVQGLNNVDDVEETKIFRAIGALENKSEKSWEFNNAFKSSVVSKANISKIKIEWFDGSVRNYYNIDYHCNFNVNHSGCFDTFKESDTYKDLELQYGKLEEIERIAKQGPPSSSAEVYEFVEIMPELIGGLEGLQKRLQYPIEAKQNSLEGRVIVELIVGREGKPYNINIYSSDNAAFNNEAIRLISESTFSPGMINDNSVYVKLLLPIRFRL